MLGFVEELSRLGLDGDGERQQALLDQIIHLSSCDGGLASVMGDDREGWSVLVNFAFERRFGWSEGGGE